MVRSHRFGEARVVCAEGLQLRPKLDALQEPMSGLKAVHFCLGCSLFGCRFEKCILEALPSLVDVPKNKPLWTSWPWTLPCYHLFRFFVSHGCCVPKGPKHHPFSPNRCRVLPFDPRMRRAELPPAMSWEDFRWLVEHSSAVTCRYYELVTAIAIHSLYSKSRFMIFFMICFMKMLMVQFQLYHCFGVVKSTFLSLQRPLIRQYRMQYAKSMAVARRQFGKAMVTQQTSEQVERERSKPWNLENCWSSYTRLLQKSA